MREIAFGQFYPGRSLLHRLDPRAKIIMLISFIVLVFCTSNYVSLSLVVASVLGVVLLSRVPLRLYFKSLKMIVVIVLITSALNLFYGTGEPLWQWGVLKVTVSGINNAVFVAVRIISLILISSALTFTTSPNDLTDAIERLLKPLTIFNVKVHEIAMMMTIALRFVPLLLEETDKIMSAQKARGADMESGSLVQRIKALIPVLIPLFVSAFRRAYELAVAMECRCYQGGEGRTRMKSLKLSARDFVSFTVVAVIIVGVILCNVLLPHTVR